MNPRMQSPSPRGRGVGVGVRSMVLPSQRAHAHPPLRATKTAAGFSLLEVLLVMGLFVIISVLAATAITGGFAGMQLRSDAREVAAQLRWTRTQAIATGQPQRFTIDPHAHTWTAPKNRTGEIARPLGIAFFGAREVQPREGEGAILFFPDGASTGGRVQLSAKRAAMNVDVTWLTGEVTLERGEVAR
jgi:general secretion pathway protein H